MTPEPVALAVAESIALDGLSSSQAGRAFGLSPSTGNRIANRKAELIAKLRESSALRWARKVLRRSDAITDALAASAENPENRNQAQAARVLLEGAGQLASFRDVTINGDVTVDQSTVNNEVRVLVANASTTEELRAQAEALRSKLGF